MPKGIFKHKPTSAITKEKLKRIALRNGSGKWMAKKLGEDSNTWKGDKIKYSGLHMWIVKMLGKPDTCEECGKTGLIGCKINWANISGLYKREVSDYKRLCIPCHRVFDYSRKKSAL